MLFRVVRGDLGAASRVHAALKARGVLVKDLSTSHPLCANCLRVTVSTPDENATFVAALKASLPEASPFESASADVPQVHPAP